MKKINKNLLLLIVVPATIIFSGCFQSTWTKKDIEKRLKKVFPAAVSIRIMSDEEADMDTFKMPPAVYKAIVNERDIPGENFLFYFYRASPLDKTEFDKIVSTVLRIDLAGNWEPTHLFSTPQFTNPGNLLLVYAFPFSQRDSFGDGSRGGEIRKVFGILLPKVKKKELPKN